MAMQISSASDRQNCRRFDMRWSKRLLRLGPMLVADHEARSLCASGIPNPNLTIRMQTPSLRGRHGVAPGTVEQAGVGLAAIGMDAAIVLHDLLPSRLAPGERG